MRISKPPDERRAELIAAARRLFDLRGVDNTRVSDIVREVGVAQGVFYYYFKSKAEMVQVVTAQVTGEVCRKADRLLADGKLSFCEKLAGLIELYIDLVDQFLGDDETCLNPFDIITVLPGTPQETPGSAAGKVWDILTERLLELVDVGVAAGDVTAAFPRESILVVLGGLYALATQRLPSHKTIYAITEQGLGIQKGRLTRLLPL